jgi:hypothetical protein
MNELEIAKNALEQIVGYYMRSRKNGKNTCYKMYLEAEKALQEMSLLTKRAADEPLEYPGQPYCPHGNLWGECCHVPVRVRR